MDFEGAGRGGLYVTTCSELARGTPRSLPNAEHPSFLKHLPHPQRATTEGLSPSHLAQTFRQVRLYLRVTFWYLHFDEIDGYSSKKGFR